MEMRMLARRNLVCHLSRTLSGSSSSVYICVFWRHADMRLSSLSGARASCRSDQPSDIASIFDYPTETVQRKAKLKPQTGTRSKYVPRQIYEILFLRPPDSLNVHGTRVRKRFHQQPVKRRNCQLTIFTFRLLHILLVSIC